MGLHGFPSLAVVDLHPVVFAILNLARVLQCLRKEIAQVIVVRVVLETKVADVAEVLVEFLCKTVSLQKWAWRDETNQESRRRGP